MDLNRNQWFLFGLLLLFLGLQLKYVDSFVLNEKSSRFIAEKMKARDGGADSTQLMMLGASPPEGRRVVRPPKWIGWALIAVGAVLVLHSLAMKRPD